MRGYPEGTGAPAGVGPEGFLPVVLGRGPDRKLALKSPPRRLLSAGFLVPPCRWYDPPSLCRAPAPTVSKFLQTRGLLSLWDPISESRGGTGKGYPAPF